MAAPFVTTIDVKLAEKMKSDLRSQGFEISALPHALFSARKPRVSCTLYDSGKLVVQGKEMQEFIHFYLEPEIFHDLRFTTLSLLDTSERIGSDEAGKGDFFGPLCIGAVFVDEKGASQLKEWGVRDCKGLSDAQVIAIGKKIIMFSPHHIVKINPAKYNELWARSKNLNTLMAWAHVAAIEQLTLKTGCKKVIVDQFAREYVVESAVKKRALDIELIQRTKAEEDLAVAGGSIIARMTFLESLQKMKGEWEMEFPKGASERVIEAGRLFVQRFGKEALSQVAKVHFKTAKELI